MNCLEGKNESNTVIDTEYNTASNNALVPAALEQQNIEALSPAVLAAYREIAARSAIVDFKLSAKAIGGPGENSYGSVLKVLLTPTRIEPTRQTLCPLYTILKIAPTSLARRSHIRAKDLYAREVFMYGSVFSEFDALARKEGHSHFTMVPRMLYATLKDGAEFIIFEDLSSLGFISNSRSNLPTYDLVVCAFRAIAQMHALSFILQVRTPQKFADLVAQMDDNLFTTDMEEVSLEFGKKYVKRTRYMLEADLKDYGEDTIKTREVVQALQKIEANFHEICLDAVNGAASAPYAVICHGDFWNNNILYEFDCTNQRAAIHAKMIDFQISRYSSPILDLVHYLFACTEKTLRDAHFLEFMQIYYDTLTQTIHDYQLDPTVLYPETVFRSQLRQFGVYGFCMSAFSVPFFILNASELPDLEKVSEGIRELSSSSVSSDTDEANNEVDEMQQKGNKKITLSPKVQNAADFVDEYDLLTERNLPIFKRRMIGNILDLQKYEMIKVIMKYKICDGAEGTSFNCS